jgi:hypothetical protein
MLPLFEPNRFDLIFLAVAAVYAIRKTRLKELKASDIGVDIEYFTTWKEAEIKSINVLMWATWKLFIIKECIIALSIIFPPCRMASFVMISAATAIAQFIGLFIAAFYGTKARKLKKAAGIKASFFPSTKGANSVDGGSRE